MCVSWAESGGRAELGGPGGFELGAPAGRAEGVLGGFRRVSLTVVKKVHVNFGLQEG